MALDKSLKTEINIENKPSYKNYTVILKYTASATTMKKITTTIILTMIECFEKR